MRDQLDDRVWTGGYRPFSADLPRKRTSSADPLPIVARAMALVLAVSLASLSLSVAIA